MELRDRVIATMRQIAEENESPLNDQISDNTVLLESGLDSLGFAILVARLEEDLGYDPFTRMTEAVYPRTFGEFVTIYQRYAP